VFFAAASRKGPLPQLQTYRSQGHRETKKADCLHGQKRTLTLYPDHKSIAEFRRMHREAVTAAGAEPVQLARSCGLIRGEWIAIDGTKFRAVAGADSVRERQALEKYLDSMEKADEEQHASIAAS
jgi:hypothetical protein